MALTTHRVIFSGLGLSSWRLCWHFKHVLGFKGSEHQGDQRPAVPAKSGSQGAYPHILWQGGSGPGEAGSEEQQIEGAKA